MYFYAGNPKDMSDFANGRVTFKIQADSAGQQISFLVQDADGLSSPTLDLQDYGFDSSLTAVSQPISIPVRELTTQGIDLTRMDRLFQAILDCPSFSCHTWISDIYWKLEEEEQGILEGATNYTGDYPTPASVSFTTKDNRTLNVKAFPGQVQVFFSSPITEDAATLAIQDLGGTVLSKIPELHYYLVGVPEGSESTFITEIRTVSGVRDAVPNTAVKLRADAVVINEDYFTTEKPVPLNLPPGIVVFDQGFNPGEHGHTVADTITNNGGTVGGLVNLAIQCVGCTGETSAHHIGLIIAAAAQGNSIFNPGQPLIANISYGPELPDGMLAEEATAAQVADNQAANEAFISSILLGVSNIPEDMREDLAITFAFGNSHVDLSQVLANIGNDAVLADIMSNNFLFAGTNQPFSNYVTGANPDVVISNNTEAADGTSFASPAVAAILEQAINQTGITLQQAVQANKLADDANGEVVLSEVIDVIEEELPAAEVDGDWLGTYNETSVGDGGWTYYSGGTLSMSITSAETSFSGSAFADGIELRWVETGEHAFYTSSNGTVDGTISGLNLTGTFTLPIAETGRPNVWSFTATLSGDTIQGTFTDPSSGSFTLTRQ